MPSQTLKGPRFELTIGDCGYPDALRGIEEPPPRLYGIGNPEALGPSIAVIGARKATPYGLSAAKRFAAHAARRGVPIVSGGARGCDQEAHKAALAAHTPTVVVFGSGVDFVYPKCGFSLFQNVIDAGGAVISENPSESPPVGFAFRRRNRIIAGLAMLVVIAEAGLPSGTFSTADAALASDRIVAAVPGSITSPNSKGANYLIAQGAVPLIDEATLDAAIDAAFAHLPLSVAQAIPAGKGPKRWERVLRADPVLNALAAEPFNPGELCAYFGLSPAQLASRLAQYEMDGLVERGRDGRYQAVAGAIGA